MCALPTVLLTGEQRISIYIFMFVYVRPIFIILIILIAHLLMPACSVAQETEYRGDVEFGSRDEEEIPDWRELASRHLPVELHSKLEERGLVLVDEGIPQIFNAYVESDVTMFVTSDALLHAFHVLLEESVTRLEARNAEVLSRFLDAGFTGLDKAFGNVAKKSPTSKEAHRKARVILAVPMDLLGRKRSKFSDDLEKEIGQELKRIRNASEISMPRWLGEPRPEYLAIDYQRCKPVGEYAESESLGDYFRAVRWLQSVVLWSDREADWLTLYYLSEAVSPASWSDAKFSQMMKMTEGLERVSGFFGNAKDLGLIDIIRGRYYPEDQSPPTEKKVLKTREELPEYIRNRGFYARSAPDRIRTVEGDQNAVGVSILSASILPDTIQFRDTVGIPYFPEREFPSGLEVAGRAGSSFANSILEKEEPEDRRGFISAPVTENPFDTHTNIYGGWFQCMKHLFAEPDPLAPALFRSEPWQRKSCETVLASWAHMRRVATLQARLDVHYSGITDVPSGLVEPNPPFFAELAELAERCSRTFESSGAFLPNRQVQVREIRQVTEVFRELPDNMKLKPREPASETSFRPNRDEEPDSKSVYDYVGFGEYYLPHQDAIETLAKADLLSEELWDLDGPDQIREMVRLLDQLAAELETGKRPAMPDEFAAELRDRWRELQVLCRRLEMIAYKQLHGVPFSGDDEGLLLRIGPELGGLEFYDGNAWLTPMDNAPRIAEIYHNTQAGQRLHIATGRPATVYLLYPWKGKQILCRGGVMTYYEIKSPKPLDDREWKEMLDFDSPPERPSWALPENPGKPEPEN